jgi:GTP-binding protein
MVVDSVAGTTRDAVDTTFERGGKTYVLVDTAGLRRDRKVTDPVEFYSVTRALRAISRADLVLLVIDVSREPSRQDARLAALAEEQGKGIVVAFNKWDLVDDPVGVRRAIEEEFARQYPFLDFVPRRSVPTAELNRAVHEILERVRPPATPSGRHLKLYYATQTGSRPPTFSLFVNNPRYRQQNYVSYLERGLRQRFGFHGTPIVLEWKASH